MPKRETLPDADIKKRLSSMPDWSKNGKSIVRSLNFETYQEAIDFVCILAEVADGCNHTPDIEIKRNEVTLHCTTHEYDGVTEYDFDLAHKIERLIADTVFEGYVGEGEEEEEGIDHELEGILDD